MKRKEGPQSGQNHSDDVTPLPLTGRSSRIARRTHDRKRRARRVKSLAITLAVCFILACGVVGFTSVLVAFETPFGIHWRMSLAETIASTRHYTWARYITTAIEYEQIMKQLHTPVVQSDPSQVHVAPVVAPAASVVEIHPLSGSGYTGYVMLVHNPKLIRLVAAQVHNGFGEYITDMAKRVTAVAGTNASGFEDPKGNGWGGIPVGLEVIGGQTIAGTPGAADWATVGFTAAGVMVMGQYTAVDLKQLGVRDAMQFHPELVVNGQPTITSGDGGWGSGPRTAIGQTKDGTVIFIVMNGRFHGGAGMGATQRQVMDIMLQYHAYNACAMDGGSSSVLVNQGAILNSPSTIDPSGQRHLPDAWMVFPSVVAANAYTP